jgi:phospholipid-transporting ATPase
MSVIIQCPDGTRKLLLKGADSAVLNIIESSNGEELGAKKRQAELSLATLGHLDRYAREGLRTLVIASKDLTAADVRLWNGLYKKASSALADRAGLLREAAELVENNLTLLGATGIEDKLQLGVPETIALLREANMHVWVLTGDKQETAISIAFSCLLITRDMEQIIINETTLEGCKEALSNARSLYGITSVHKKKESRFRWRKKKTVDNIFQDGSPSESQTSGGNRSTGHSRSDHGQTLALVIDGNSLVHCLSDELEQEVIFLSHLEDVSSFRKMVG